MKRSYVFAFGRGFQSFNIRFQLPTLNRCRPFDIKIGALSSHTELLCYTLRRDSSDAICLLMPPLPSPFSCRNVQLLFHTFPLKLSFPSANRKSLVHIVVKQSDTYRASLLSLSTAPQHTCAGSGSQQRLNDEGGALSPCFHWRQFQRSGVRLRKRKLTQCMLFRHTTLRVSYIQKPDFKFLWDKYAPSEVTYNVIVEFTIFNLTRSRTWFTQNWAGLI